VTNSLAGNLNNYNINNNSETTKKKKKKNKSGKQIREKLISDEKPRNPVGYE
jgi:hypothetical protein